MTPASPAGLRSFLFLSVAGVHAAKTHRYPTPMLTLLPLRPASLEQPRTSPTANSPLTLAPRQHFALLYVLPQAISSLRPTRPPILRLRPLPAWRNHVPARQLHCRAYSATTPTSSTISRHINADCLHLAHDALLAGGNPPIGTASASNPRINRPVPLRSSSSLAQYRPATENVAWLWRSPREAAVPRWHRP